MGVVMFDPSALVDEVIVGLASDEGLNLLVDFPEVSAIPKAAWYIELQRSFSINSHVFVFPLNPNKILVSVDDIEDWLDNLAASIVEKYGSGDFFGDDCGDSFGDEWEDFNRFSTTPAFDPINTLKMYLTNVLESDIMVLTGDKREIVAGIINP